MHSGAGSGGTYIGSCATVISGSGSGGVEDGEAPSVTSVGDSTGIVGEAGAVIEARYSLLC